MEFCLAPKLGERQLFPFHYDDTRFQPPVNFHQTDSLWGNKSGSEMCLAVDVQNIFSKNGPFTISHILTMEIGLFLQSTPSQS